MNTLCQTIPCIAVSLALGACDIGSVPSDDDPSFRKTRAETGPSLESDTDGGGDDTGGDTGGEPVDDCDPDPPLQGPALYTLHERSVDPNHPTADDDPTQLLRIDSATGIGTEVCELANKSNYSTSVIIPWVTSDSVRTYPMIAWNNGDQRIEVVDMCDCDLFEVWDPAIHRRLPGIAPIVEADSLGTPTTTALVAVDVENDKLLVLDVVEQPPEKLPRVAGFTEYAGLGLGNADATVVYPHDDLYDTDVLGDAQILLRRSDSPGGLDTDEMWVIPYTNGTLDTAAAKKFDSVFDFYHSPIIDEASDCLREAEPGTSEESNFRTLGFTQMESPALNPAIDSGFYLCAESGQLITMRRHCAEEPGGPGLLGFQNVGSDPIWADYPTECNDLAHEPRFYLPGQSCF